VLAPRVRRFLERRVDNLEQLEITLLLYQHQHRSWTANDVADALRLSTASAAQHLEILGQRALLDVRIDEDVRYRCGPATADLAADVKQVAEAYRDARREVVAFVLSLGRRSLRDFSDSFKITKDDDRG
jgi:DNA-binding MarR family transcriptional regulator